MAWLNLYCGLWIITPSSLVDGYQRFDASCSLGIQDILPSHLRNTTITLPFLAYWQHCAEDCFL
jgi:hypothetical protein